MAFKIIFFFLVIFKTAYAEDDITVKIINTSNQEIKFKIDNFKYIDKNRVWRTLPALVHTMETVYFTSKWGYLELQIKDPLSSLIIERYVPSGKNKEVTIVINDDNDSLFSRLKARRYLGIK